MQIIISNDFGLHFDDRAIDTLFEGFIPYIKSSLAASLHILKEQYSMYKYELCSIDGIVKFFVLL